MPEPQIALHFRGFAGKMHLGHGRSGMESNRNPRRETLWRRSGFCANGECVEVAAQDGTILVRNPGTPGSVVRFTTDEWRVFTDGVRSGEYDDLACPRG